MAVGKASLLDPTVMGSVNALNLSGGMSQYMDYNTSVFDPSMAAMGGYVPGCGIGYGVNVDAMGNLSDNMTSLQFKFRSNQHVLGSYGEIMQKNLPEMAAALREGKMGKATMLYNEIYEAISKNYGEELTTQEQRVAYDQAIKATISRTYQQMNGRPLAMDINENGEGFFVNGFMQGFTFGNHHGNSAEEVESYMTGTGIEGYTGKQLAKGVGKVLGYTTSIGACAGIGFCFGGPVGAAIGAGVGCLITLGSWIFGGNEPTKVTKAY